MIVVAVLQKDADGLRLGLANQRRQAVGAFHGHVRANEAEHAMKLVRAVPGGHQRAHRAGADAGNGVVVGVLREVVLARHFGNQLFQQEAREARAQRIVLEYALEAVLVVVGERGEHSRIDEDADQRRQLVLRDQVVEHHRNADVIAQRSTAIQENHERRGPRRVVIRRNVERIVVRRAGVELSGRQHQFGDDRALRNAGVRLRIGAQAVIVGAVQSGGQKQRAYDGHHRSPGKVYRNWNAACRARSAGPPQPGAVDPASTVRGATLGSWPGIELKADATAFARPPGKSSLVVLLVLLLVGARSIASYAIEIAWWKELGQFDTWLSMLSYSLAPVPSPRCWLSRCCGWRMRAP